METISSSCDKCDKCDTKVIKVLYRELSRDTRHTRSIRHKTNNYQLMSSTSTNRNIYIVPLLQYFMDKKILTAYCRFCGKQVFSLYRGQLTHNLEMHLKHCKFNPDHTTNQKTKGEHTEDLESSGASLEYLNLPITDSQAQDFLEFDEEVLE